MGVSVPAYGLDDGLLPMCGARKTINAGRTGKQGEIGWGY